MPTNEKMQEQDPSNPKGETGAGQRKAPIEPPKRMASSGRAEWDRYLNNMYSVIRSVVEMQETAAQATWDAQEALERRRNHGRSAKIEKIATAGLGSPPSQDGATRARERFPTPSGTRWGDISIRFKDGHTIAVRVGTATAVYNYTQMGMVNRKNGNPTRQWELLRRFAEEYGILDWRSPGADRRNQKRRENLAKDMRAFFGIDSDPFELTSGRKGWKARFSITPEG